MAERLVRSSEFLRDDFDDRRGDLTPSRPPLRLVQELDDDLPEAPSTEMDELFDDRSSFYGDGLSGSSLLFNFRPG